MPLDASDNAGTPDMTLTFDQAAQDVIRMAHHAGIRDWVPATSGNFSVRMDAKTCAVTASGGDKGKVTMAGVIEAPIDGPAPPRQSAEAELHYGLYRMDPKIGAVAHIHAKPGVLASLVFAKDEKLVLEGLELLKAFEGTKTHETALTVPIVANDQDMTRLERVVRTRLTQDGMGWGYLIAGHGLYVWGPDAHRTIRHMDAFDYLFRLVLNLRGIPA
jgi:methylthioribulose-1-phosphate dehydratase